MYWCGGGRICEGPTVLQHSVRTFFSRRRPFLPRESLTRCSGVQSLGLRVFLYLFSLLYIAFIPPTDFGSHTLLRYIYRFMSSSGSCLYHTAILQSRGCLPSPALSKTVSHWTIYVSSARRLIPLCYWYTCGAAASHLSPLNIYQSQVFVGPIYVFFFFFLLNNCCYFFFFILFITTLIFIYFRSIKQVGRVVFCGELSHVIDRTRATMSKSEMKIGFAQEVCW